MKIVVPTREIGNAKLFKLNEDNPIVKDLVRLHDTLIYGENEKYLSKKLVVSKLRL